MSGAWAQVLARLLTCGSLNQLNHSVKETPPDGFPQQMHVVGRSPGLDGVCDWETEGTGTSCGVVGRGAAVNGE